MSFLIMCVDFRLKYPGSADRQSDTEMESFRMSVRSVVTT
jgi:hypothetical protein